MFFKIILLTLHTSLSLLHTNWLTHQLCCCSKFISTNLISHNHEKKKEPNIHNKIFKMILEMDGRVSGQSLKYLTCQSLSAFKGVYVRFILKTQVSYCFQKNWWLSLKAPKIKWKNLNRHSLLRGHAFPLITSHFLPSK